MIKGRYVIGILGGVGSGKSTVLSYITGRYRASAILADETGRELMKPGKSVYFALCEVFGSRILKEDGTIDTGALSSVVFESAESQKKVNEIEHPLIKSEIEWRIGKVREDVVFLEAALLIEGGLKEICDEIWLITADREVRIKRLMESRGYSREQCEKIISLQMEDAELKKHARIRIDNSGTLEDMRDAVDYYMAVLSDDLKRDLRRY